MLRKGSENREEVSDRQGEAAREPAAVLQVFYFELNVFLSSSNTM